VIVVLLAIVELDFADEASVLLEVSSSTEMIRRRLVCVPARPRREGHVARLAEVLLRATPVAGLADEHLVVVTVAIHFGFVPVFVQSKNVNNESGICLNRKGNLDLN